MPENMCGKVKNILIEHYFAVYEDQWYLGRIVNLTEESCRVKFLKEELENFVWPKNEDIQTVDNKFIFYGPVSLFGSNPVQIRRADRLKIRKLYSEFKYQT